ncbi:hypothetical protein Acr_17g0010780 [Actinidia rufa]|uniref:Uncharacterized protein n=1 Tax=Actinidia rufa TaxID=165716 RepID=A0A7J0G3Y8_9ERIC|nr:hypothetical protein Acr_17g0010780 [Actinidia rufa]
MAIETARREHLQWASICVRGTGVSTPATVTIGMGSFAYVCPIWVESGARVVRRSEPTRYCDGTCWRESMGKQKASEGNGNTVGVTRGSKVEAQFEKRYQRPRSGNYGSHYPKRADQRLGKGGDKIRVCKEKERIQATC